MITDPEVLWEKPGPGAWSLDRAHTVGPVSPILQAVFPSAMADGFRSFTGRYGLPISHIDVRYVNGLPYGSVRIAGVPPSDRPAPPAAVLRVLTRVHPELRRRNRQARVALERRTWHDDLRRWFDELRPARLASLRALQAVDPTVLDEQDLAGHVEDCVAELADGLREHFSLVGAAGLPVGLYVVQQAERGRSAAEAIGDLAGAAAASTAATVPALAAIADALADADVDPTSLDDVAGASPAAAAALDAYLDEYGQRVVGAFDVTGRRLVELPELVLRSIAAARGRTAGDPPTSLDDDTVVGDARLAVASRDDHSGISCTWPVGLTRRALLAAGARLHGAGVLDHPDHVVEATAKEVTSLLRGATGAPTARVLTERAALRRHLASLPAPGVLGTPQPPPDPAVFPTGLRRTATAMGAFLGTLEATAPTDVRGGSAGVGIGRRVHRGRAVVAVEPEDAIDRLEPGDVLITSTTTPAFNCVLPIAGALVTAHGGLMSHAGIAARELDIPAVLGLVDVLDRIPDGAEVEVDPVTATVRLAPLHIAFGPGVTTPAVGPDRVGGKAAGLIAMAGLGLPVPPGVVLPVDALGAGSGDDAAPVGAELDAAVRAAVQDLEEMTGRRLGDPDRPLVVSVRSGAAVSMPGMLDTVLDVGTTPEVAAGLARTTGDPGFADDTHRRLLVGWATVVDGLPEAEVAVTAAAAPSSAALAERLAALGSRVPADPIDQVVAAVAAVHRSWDGERARTFREREGIDDALGTSVTIQAMVFGNRGPDSGTGVAFSRDPSTGAPGIVGDLLVGAQGDDVVGGAHHTLPLSEMAGRWPDVHRELVEAMTVLERHHRDMVDVELTVEEGRLHLLQARPGRRSPAAALRLAVDMAEDPTFPLDRAGAVERCRELLAAPPGEVAPLSEVVVAEHLLVAGLAASPGRGTGALSVTVEDALRRHDAGEAVVLVRPHTSPADVAAMAIAQGVVTATGGLVSHAAVVARSWGLPAVVGAAGLHVDDLGVTVAGRRIDVGEIVTVDGSAGLLLLGSHPVVTTDPPALAVLRGWAADLAPAEPTATRSPGAGTDGVAVGPAGLDAADAPAEVDIVRVAVLRGRVAIDGIAEVTGARRDVLTESVARLVDGGLLAERGVAVSATAAGRELVAADVADVVDRHGSAFATLLDRFQVPDRALKQLVTDHQGRMAGAPPGDGVAARPEVDEDLVRRLDEEVHGTAATIIAAAAELVARLGRYRERLEVARARLAAGDERHLAHPSVDSYHSIWFELHEELIALAGTDRAREVDAGRA